MKFLLKVLRKCQSKEKARDFPVDATIETMSPQEMEELVKTYRKFQKLAEPLIDAMDYSIREKLLLDQAETNPKQMYQGYLICKESMKSVIDDVEHAFLTRKKDD